MIAAIGPHSCLRDAREAGVYVLPVRDRVVSICHPYAVRLAHRLIHLPDSSRIDPADLEGAAMLGLVEGVDSYQPRRGVQIQTHLWNRIRKRLNEERIKGHWTVMRPPWDLASRYMAGRMSESEQRSYVDTYVRCYESDLISEPSRDVAATDSAGLGWQR